MKKLHKKNIMVLFIIITFIFSLFCCDPIWHTLFPPSEDELPLYEWEVVDVFANELASSIDMMCRHNGSYAPHQVYTTYGDRVRLELISLTSFMGRTFDYQGVTTDLPGYYDTAQEGMIDIYISSISPPPGFHGRYRNQF